MNGLKVDGFWEVTGDPNHGGLPRGYDLDLFTGIMAVWGRGDARRRLISLSGPFTSFCRSPAASRKPARTGASGPGSTASMAFRSTSYATIYDPGAKDVHRPQEQFPALQQMALDETPEASSAAA